MSALPARNLKTHNFLPAIHHFKDTRILMKGCQVLLKSEIAIVGASRTATCTLNSFMIGIAGRSSDYCPSLQF